MDRRTTLKWILTASTTMPFLPKLAWTADADAALVTAYVPVAHGYGSDPDLLKVYRPGELWPLSFTPEQRGVAAALSDLIIPMDETSPSASTVGVVDFIDEWISAPYPSQKLDRETVFAGFLWLDEESEKRFNKSFIALTPAQQCGICDDICYLPNARPQFAAASKFFACYRNLTVGGFYSTPAGRKDLQYMGNSPSVTFAGPPLEALKQAGLA